MKDIEHIITKNRDEFNDKEPQINHENRFLWRLRDSIKHFISIVPYLVKVLIATVIIFIASVIIWNNFIRKDRHEITLKNKISLVINKITTK